MPGRASDSKLGQYVGAAVALVAVVGYVVFDWRFGDPVSPAPVAIGVACALAAVGWTVYRRRG